MQDIKILQYGIYDSKSACENLKVSPIREVKHFEFDFIISNDNDAVSYIDEKSFKLMPNLLIIRKPYQKSNSRLHFKCYCLHLYIPKGHLLYNELISFPNYLPFINEKSYHAIFESLMLHLVKQPIVTTDYFVLSKIFELIYKVKKDLPKNQNIRHRNLKKENQSIRDAINYIKTNFSSPITLSDLGKIAGYSPNHFQHVFRTTMGITPQKYLEDVRISHAKYLLSKNEKSITEISYDCGFSSHSHFTKVFKTHTMLTPFEFQQKSQFRYFV